MNLKPIAILSISLMLLSACDFGAVIQDIFNDSQKEEPGNPVNADRSKKPAKRKMFTGTKEKKYSNGKLKTSIEYKEGKRHGKAVQYYVNGNIHLSDNYIFGKREGVSKYYYQDGTIYRETDYINGKRNGWKKEYDRSGDLKYKAGYHKGEPTGEFIEYGDDGKPKPQPKLVVKEIGWDAGHSRFGYEVKMVPIPRSPRYFLGPNKKNFSYSESMLADVKDGVGTIYVRVPKGKAIEMDAMFLGEGTNKYKYPITSKLPMKLSIKNP